MLGTYLFYNIFLKYFKQKGFIKNIIQIFKPLKNLSKLRILQKVFHVTFSTFL